MGRKSRRKQQGAPEQPTAPPPRPTPPDLDEAPPPDSRWPSAPVAALLGGLVLIVLVLLDPPTIDRSPRAIQLVSRLAAALGALGVAGWALRRQLGAHLAPWTVLSGLGILALALGIAPEWFELPLRATGERIGPFPVALGAPLAGAGLLAGRSRKSLLIGGIGCAWIIAGLLQPHTDVTELRLAILYHLAPFDGVRSAFVVGLLLLAVLGLTTTLNAALRPSPLRLITGIGLLAWLPAWQLVRMADGVAGPLAALVLVTGASIWLLLPLPAALREVPDATRKWMPRVVEALGLLGLVTLWLLLKSFTWRWSTTDENIYFYDALLLSKGQLPYKDFFFAHPPMHLVVPALLFKIFGFSLGLAKAIPAVAALLTGLLVYAIGRRSQGPIVGLLSLGAFFFAHELLQASTNLNGVNLTSVWLTLGLYLVLKNRPALAGASLGIAVGTGFYAIAGALALVTMVLFRPVPKRWMLGVVFAAVAGGINLICWLIAPEAFVESVYTFHGLKAEKDLVPEFIKTFYHHTPLAFGILLAPVAGAWARFRGVQIPGQPSDPELRGSFFSPVKLWTEPGLGAIKITWLVCIALLVEFTMFQELYSFYFTLLIPTAALCTGYVLAMLLASVIHEVNELASGRANRLAAGAVALCLAWACWVPMARQANWIFSNSGPPPKRERAKGVNPEWLKAGEPRYYRWIEPAAYADIAGPVVRALFWRDHRLRGAMTPGYRHYLWQKSLHLDAADEIAEYVKANSAEDETVAGNSLVAPAVALFSERRIAANFVDTNAKRFKTELTSLEAFFTAICSDRIRYLVASPSGFFSNRLLQQLPTVRKYFKPVKQFASPLNKFKRPRPWGVTLWEIRDDQAIDEATRCQWIEPQPRPKRRPQRTR